MQILDKINKQNISDAFALSMTKFFRIIADTFFAKRYGHRAVVLETVAGVPGMVAGVWMHFKSLRVMKAGYGEQIREMLAEAENERMHLMFFIEIAKPNYFERFIVLFAQVIFGLFYLFMYIFDYLILMLFIYICVHFCIFVYISVYSHLSPKDALRDLRQQILKFDD